MSFLLPALLLACGTPTGDTGGDSAAPLEEATCDASGGRVFWLVDSLAFQRADGDISDGFDLDDDVSSSGGSGGCGIGDFVGADGTEGIDNAFARLIPALETTEFVGAEAIINDTIKNGEVMLIGELAGLDVPADDTAEDECVTLALRRGTGAPMLDTQGEIMAGQTLDLDPDFDDVVVEAVPVRDGSAEGRPFSVDLAIQFLDADVTFGLRGGAIRYDLHEDGSASGVFAGGIETQELIDLAANTGISAEVEDVLRTLLGTAADLEPDDDGDCQRISITFAFTATPVYVFDDALDE